MNIDWLYSAADPCMSAGMAAAFIATIAPNTNSRTDRAFAREIKQIIFKMLKIKFL
jgi:hypothetical protein